MLTINQLLKNRRNKHKKYRVGVTPALKYTYRKIFNNNFIPKEILTRAPSPHKSGRCLSVNTISPKKPNSAQRLTAKVVLSNHKVVNCYIPGYTQGHGLQRSSRVLIRGGRTQDLVGLHYKIIRGKLDCAPCVNRSTSRSRYGVKHWGRLPGSRVYSKSRKIYIYSV